MVWILLGYMWLFLHRPFEVWPILATIRLERLYMIFTILAWFVIAPKTWTSNRNNIGVFLIGTAIFFATLMSPYSGFGDNLATENWFKCYLVFLLIMTSVKTEKDLKILVTGFVLCFTLYMLHSYREYHNGRGVYRMGIWRMVGVDESSNDPNSFGSSINYVIPLLLPFLTLALQQTKKIRFRLLMLILGILGLAVLCIQMTGSRSSFVALLATLFGVALLSKYRLRVLLFLAVAAPAIWFILPEDLQNRYMTIIDPSRGPANAQASVEGRWEGFHGGIAVWEQNMMFGVGPGCYSRATGSSIQTHNLIGQVLSELGSLGAFAYIAMTCCVLINHLDAFFLYRRMKREGREKEGIYAYRVSFAVLWTFILLLLIGTGSHNAFRPIWVWYGAFQGIAVELLRKKAYASPARIEHARSPRLPGRTET